MNARTDALDMPRPSNVSRFSLYVLAVMVLVLAIMVWNLRQQRKVQAAQLQSVLQQRQRVQRAVALLYGALWADNHTTYSSQVTTHAVYGNRRIHTVAKITREPQQLAITYVSGDRSGLSSGFNQRVVWRQDNPEAPMQAYAAISQDTTAMMARRFAWMLNNYGADWKGQAKVSGRDAHIIDITPFNPVPGAHGPAKRLWIDAETSLTLRVETFNYQMQPVMSSTLSKLDLSPQITPATFPPMPKITSVAKNEAWRARDMGTDEASVERLTQVKPPKPKELPPGFKFESVGVYRCDDGPDAPLAALSRYSDGLNTLTLFALKADAELAPEPQNNSSPGQSKSPDSARENSEGKGEGAVETCDFGPGTLVMRNTKDMRLIAVADLPSQTLYRILGVTSSEVAAHDTSRKALARAE